MRTHVTSAHTSVHQSTTSRFDMCVCVCVRACVCVCVRVCVHIFQWFEFFAITAVVFFRLWCLNFSINLAFCTAHQVLLYIRDSHFTTNHFVISLLSFQGATGTPYLCLGKNSQLTSFSSRGMLNLFMNFLVDAVRSSTSASALDTEG